MVETVTSSLTAETNHLILSLRSFIFTRKSSILSLVSSVTAVFKTPSGFTYAGAVVAQSGCWSMFKGGLTVDSSGFSELYFEVQCLRVECNISVAVQAHKRSVKIHAVNAEGEVLDGAKISIRQNKANFPFGSAITKEILHNTAYQNWFASRFTVTVFENEMKWYATENIQGKEDYSVSDAMVQFAKQHGIAVRGHNILWDDQKYQPWWVKSLNPADLKAAADKRVQSIVSRYAGDVIGWDVINENLHFSFFENLLGANASSDFFQKAHQLDPKATMFLNDYNTIEQSSDWKSSPAQYLQKLREIKDAGLVGIGLEGHFSTPNIPYMRSSIDTLAAARAPIWLTEVDVGESPNQAWYLEQVLREGRSHPAVHGIVLWAGWRPNGCWRMCLTDGNFNNLPTGNVIDKLINEWKPKNTNLQPHCLPEPEKPQYRGGIIVNPEFDDGFNGWTVLGKGAIEERISNRGNRFLVAHSRSHPSDSFSQKLYLIQNKWAIAICVVSCWI